MRKCILICPDELKYDPSFIYKVELYDGVPFIILEDSFEILSVVGSEVLHYCYTIINDLHQKKREIETDSLSSPQLSNFNLGFLPTITQRNDNIQLGMIFCKLAFLYLMVGSPSSCREFFEKAIGKIDLVKYPSPEDVLIRTICQDGIISANIYAQVLAIINYNFRCSLKKTIYLTKVY